MKRRILDGAFVFFIFALIFGAASCKQDDDVSPIVVITTVRSTDKPNGFASYYADDDFGGAGGTVYEVSTRDALRSAINQSGRKIIYVKGMIDMTNTGSGSLLFNSAGVAFLSNYRNAPAAMNEFVSSNGGGGSYAAWVAANGNHSKDANTGTSSISNAYKSRIQLNLTSNTTIIGVGGSSGIRGGTISISGASNIAIRNLVIQDPIDPFPHHEKNDGYNAQHDGICIQGDSENIWIDHCTFFDSAKVGTAPNGEKWQVYDGLLDMKQGADYITVSNCYFHDHDKTMLIGSSDSDNNDGYGRHVTIHHCYFLNCGQRLPMVRHTKTHVYNNVYDKNKNAAYASQSTINCRKGSEVIAENNYFGNVAGISSNGGSYSMSAASGGFNIGRYYKYTLESKDNARPVVMGSSRAGTCKVIQDPVSD